MRLESSLVVKSLIIIASFMLDTDSICYIELYINIGHGVIPYLPDNGK